MAYVVMAHQAVQVIRGTHLFITHVYRHVPFLGMCADMCIDMSIYMGVDMCVDINMAML